MTYYESDRGVAEYLLLHYGTEQDLSPLAPVPPGSLDFPARCVSELLDPARVPAGARGLDVGCAVGRASFELARHCREVTGLDFSHAFVATATRLARDGAVRAAVADEGDLTRELEFRVPADLPRDRVTFRQGDAMDLPPDCDGADVVLAANLICRLREPHRFLDRLPALVKPGGQLLLTTPCTWLEDYTPRDLWIGARDGTTTRDALVARLSADFDLCAEKNLPFLIREHARKFQWSIALGTAWVRRG
jgi:putative 4-mercaptohistidine N1-methyltranferase